MKTTFVVIAMSLLIGFTQNEPKNEKQAPQKQDSKQEAESSKAAEATTEDVADENPFAPIDSMHHFMEYICQPNYRALKETMAEEPQDRRVWRTIKSNALILAESSALVAERYPEEATEAEIKEWKKISLEVYESGKLLYQSNGKFELAKKHYGAMIESCNKCHKVFDDGKHQLEK